MKIRPSVIKVPEQFSFEWETVGGRDDKEGVTKNNKES